jgi:ribosomal protein L40E
MVEVAPQKGKGNMPDFARSVPQIPVVLASLILWVSFAWGLPAEPPAAEGEADVAPAEAAWNCDRCGTANDASAKYCTECGAEKSGEAKAEAEDPWAGVRISGAYDYAKCLNCSLKNEVRAERCWQCGSELPKPLKEFKYPPWVFVPGEGYYREGTLLEPPKTTKALWILGLVVTAVGVWWTADRFSITLENTTGKHMLEVMAGIPIMALGVTLMVFGFKKSEPVYAFIDGDCYELYEGVASAQTPPDAVDIACEVELTAFGF